MQARLRWYDFTDLSIALIYELLRFRQDIFIVEQRCAYPELDGLDQRAHHLLLRAEGALAGCLRVIPYPDRGQVAIGRVAVAASRRRRGLARLLMDTALARCHDDYPRCLITLGAQAHLVPFYEAFGFRAASDPYLDYGIPHVDMHRPEGAGPPG